MPSSLKYVLWTNSNPNPDTICEMCLFFIGKSFDPDKALPLPAHPTCYCLYIPTDRKPDDWNWNSVPGHTWEHWMRYVAWLLRRAMPIPIILRALIGAAKKYNREREEKEEEDANPPDPTQEENSPMPNAQPIEATAITGSIRTGAKSYAADANTHHPTRREYDCIFMRTGRVRRADGEDSNWLIPADPLQAAVPLFNGLAVYCDHPELFGFGWNQSPRTDRLIGVTSDAAWDTELQGVVGKIRLYDENSRSLGAIIGDLWDQMLTDKKAELETPDAGLSATMWHHTNLDKDTGLTATTEITKVDSVDFVYSPGAGGYIRAALSVIRPDWHTTPSPSELASTHICAPPSHNRHYDHTVSSHAPSPRVTHVHSTSSTGATAPHSTGEFTMPDLIPTQETPAEVQTAPQESIVQTQYLASLNRIAELEARLAILDGQVTGLTNLTTTEPDIVDQPEHPIQLAAFQTRLDRIEAQAAAQLEGTVIQGMGQAPGVAWHMRTDLDQVQLALDAMLDGIRPPDGTRPLTGIRELYNLLSGDYEMTTLFNSERVYLANVNSSTMAKMTADALNKRVVNEFQVYPQWWAPIVSPEDFNSLQTVKWITLGGVGELPTVPEGGAYTEMAWDDIEQQSAFIKKGGYLGLTIEAIDKDDTRMLRSAPRALAQAAWLTLSRAIAEIFTVNSGTGPSIYYDDSNTRVLFHTSNSNLGTSPLSWASWVATRTAMRQQTEHNSGERLGALTAPRYCLVPSDLEMAAVQYLASAGEPGTGDNDINPEAAGNMHDERLRIARQRVIVVDLWTDTNNWAAIANPLLYPSIGLGFRFGRTPEIFSVASPTAGLMFSNDVMPIKVRFFFATGPVDWRGMYKHNI